MSDSKKCPCKSGKNFENCCQKYLAELKLDPDKLEPIMANWKQKYGLAISGNFQKKVNSSIYRISLYLDDILSKYLHLGYKKNNMDNEDTDEAIRFIKHNILLSFFAAYSCLTEGLFIQSGGLLRSAIEDSMILLDVFNDEKQLSKVLDNKYSAKNLLTRIKNSIPKELVDYYGYFSANFTHFGPLHIAPYLPRPCLGDNYIIVVGMENIIRAILTFHIILERIYYDENVFSYFWDKINETLVFKEDNKIYPWINKIIKENQKLFPVDERKNGFYYSPKDYKPKL
jgi:hypothetical protein